MGLYLVLFNTLVLWNSVALSIEISISKFSQALSNSSNNYFIISLWSRSHHPFDCGLYGALVIYAILLLFFFKKILIFTFGNSAPLSV